MITNRKVKLPSLGRLILMGLVSVVLSLVLLFLITTRNMGEMGVAEIQARWVVLMLQKAPAAQFAAEHFGTNPASYIQHMALVWDKANPFSWWWLPLVMLVVMIFLTRHTKKKMR